MIFIDRKYLLLISPQLKYFTEKSPDLYNFRCPYCGDSQKKKTKRRAYVYMRDQRYFFKCHNCHVSTTFGKFLQYIDGEQYRQYCMDRFIEQDNYKAPEKPEPTPQKQFKTTYSLSIPSIASLPDEHYAKQYIKNRQIPEEFWSELFFAQHYKDFLDKDFPDHGKDEVPNDPRIVLLYTTSDHKITNVTGRALEAENDLRYVTVKVSDAKKVYGLNRHQPHLKTYITEGQFDSFFLPNALASGDANLRGVAQYLKKSGITDVTLVFDNQPRNKDIVREVGYAIEEGFDVVMLPYDANAKDINEMIKVGMCQEDIKELIDENTFGGLAASMKFTEWRKC